jgi:hypothetical protein
MRDRHFFQKMTVELDFTRKPLNRSFVPHMLRYESELAWLCKHGSEVDRVLHSDAFDVFFQGDPFTAHVSRDELTFVVEPHCIRSCGWNFAWLRRCYGSQAMGQFRFNFIVCSGSIGGPASEYMKLITLMTDQREWKSCWESSLDQPILNWLLWTGAIRKHGIRYRLSGCDGGFFTMQWCVTEGNVLMNEHGQVVSIEGAVPSYLHQYDRHPQFAAYVQEVCGL